MPNCLKMTKNITWVYHEGKLRTEASFAFHPATFHNTRAPIVTSKTGRSEVVKVCQWKEGHTIPFSPFCQKTHIILDSVALLYRLK